MFVYMIVNLQNDKIYIGKTVTGNLKTYLRGKLNDALGGKYNGRSYLYRAMAKYPSNVWEIFPLISSLKTNEDICFWERVLIAEYDSQNSEVGYNLCKGGEGRTDTGWHHSSETRAKLRASNLGKIRSQETRKNISKGLEGKPSNYLGHVSAETTLQKMRQSHLNPPQELRDRIAATLRAKIASGELDPPTTRGLKLSSELYKGRIPWNKGKKVSSPSIERGIRPINRKVEVIK